MHEFLFHKADFSFQKWLNKSPLAVVCYMSLSAFVIYSCMYGFRKPYTVATFTNIYFLGISYKVCLVVAQVIGYMMSKFIGIRLISTMQPQKRTTYIVICIGIAWLSLLGFAIIPAPYNIICMFVNGLPLGMVFGLVFGFLEGRKTTEIMGAFLATSFIFASGLAKTVGKWFLLQCHISDWWMPFAAGAFFVIPLLVAVWLIQQSPTPSTDDILHRSERKPMTKTERIAFIKTFGWAVTPVVIAYAVFTIVRDFCEDFANDLWIETGYQNNAGIFAQNSVIISLIVLAIVGGFFLIKSNYKAFVATHYVIIFGVIMSAVVTLLYSANIISPITWMLLGTTGMYLAYLPFNCLYFERLLSTYKIKANVGFVMYIADAFGYLGTVIVLLVKEFITIKYSWVSFFSFLFYAASLVGVILIAASLIIHHQLFKSSVNSNHVAK